MLFLEQFVRSLPMIRDQATFVVHSDEFRRKFNFKIGFFLICKVVHDVLL